MRSILRSYMKVIQITQKHILWTFLGVSMIIKCDHIVSEPHNVKFIFYIHLLHSSAVDIWQIIGHSLRYFFDLINVFSE